MSKITSESSNTVSTTYSMDGPSNNSNSSIQGVAIANFNSLPERSDYDLGRIEAMDLTKFRNSHLPGEALLLLTIPVIGWTAYAVFKSYYIYKHWKAETVLSNSNFDGRALEDKIAIITKTIQVAGPHAWQYRLERARLYLLNGNFPSAITDMEEVHKKRVDRPDEYDLKCDLVHWKQGDGKRRIKIYYQTLEEALLFAAVFTKAGRYVEAYHAYNEVEFYSQNRIFSYPSRPFQFGLVQIMNADTYATQGSLSILDAENKFLTRFSDAQRINPEN